MMRGFFAWLVAFGVLAGLSARAMPLHELLVSGPGQAHHHHPESADAPCDDGHDHPQDHDHDHDHDHPVPCDGDGQPCHKHHHSGCCAPVNLAADRVAEFRLLVPSGVLLGFRESRETVPDEPFLEQDAPPLI